MEAGWFNEESPHQVSVPGSIHSRETELQNHGVRFFLFSLSSPSLFLNLADACRSPVPRSVTSPRRRRRARSHAEKLALHGLDSSARDNEASVRDSSTPTATGRGARRGVGRTRRGHTAADRRRRLGGGLWPCPLVTGIFSSHPLPAPPRWSPESRRHQGRRARSCGCRGGRERGVRGSPPSIHAFDRQAHPSIIGSQARSRSNRQQILCCAPVSVLIFASCASHSRVLI